MTEAPWPREEFLARIRRIGDERYHSLHPFHRLLHGGKLNHGQVHAGFGSQQCFLPGGGLQGVLVLDGCNAQDFSSEHGKDRDDKDGPDQDAAALRGARLFH